MQQAKKGQKKQLSLKKFRFNSSTHPLHYIKYLQLYLTFQITLHLSKMLNNVDKSYEILARDESSRKDTISGAHKDNKTKDDFDRDAENSANSPAKSSLSNKTQELPMAKSPEVICLDSFSEHRIT